VGEVMRKIHKTSAYLTVYLTLTLTVILSLCLALIEGARQNAMFLEAECVTDIGLNSILAEYHRELLEQYNLFAIDSSYGTTQPWVQATENHLEDYLNKNLSTDDVFLDWLLYRDFLAMSLENAEITRTLILTDDNGAVFRRRAAEAIWDDSNLDLFEDVQEWLQVVESEKLTERDIAAEKRKKDKELDEYDGDVIEISETEWITVDVKNPTDALEKLRKKGILNLVIKNPYRLSEKTISLTNLLESRVKAGCLNQGNMNLEELSKGEELLERFFFQEYLLKYMCHYGEEAEGITLSYQIEYLLTGKNSDIENLKSVVNIIFAVREVANTSYVFSNQECRLIAETLAAVLATAMMIPEATEILAQILLFGWAFAESVYDVRCIMEGGRIPLMKTKDTWHYKLNSALNLNLDFLMPVEDTEGLSYEDYLRILLFLENEDELTMRAMNMIEADIRATEGNEYFRLDGCLDTVEAVVRVKSAYGYDCEITRRKGYSTQ